jgi:hypothetical protein
MPVKKALFVVTLLVFAHGAARTQQSGTLRFEVTVASDLVSSPEDGRLFVILGRTAQPEPRMGIGQTGFNAAPMFAHDIKAFAAGVTGVIDQTLPRFLLRASRNCRPATISFKPCSTQTSI